MARPGRSSPPHAPAQAEWLRLAVDVVDAALLRADARRNVLTLVRCLGWSADWHTSLTRPTIARLMDVSGLSRRCVQGWCRWLEDRGLLEVIEPGTTPRFRPAILARPAAGNLARTWQLARPGVDRTCTPSLTCGSNEAPARAYAREGAPEVKSGAGAEIQDDPPGAPQCRPGFPFGAVPRARREALGAAQAMQERAPLLRRLSIEHLRHLARPFFAAGWSPRDVLYAIDHEPGGRQHAYTAGVRSPAGWIRSRLAAWFGPDEIPLPSRSQRLAEDRRQVLAGQADRRARDEAVRAAAADYPVAAARAREMLRTRLKSSACPDSGR